MVLRSRKKWWHKILFSWITILVLVLFAIVLSRGVWGMYHKNARAAQRAADAVYEMEKVQTRKESLDKDLSHIKTSRGIEEEVRRKFDVAKEGEHLLVIIDKEVVPTETKEEVSWLQSIWHKFKQ
jgi:type II secretory pathway component PulJ